MHCLHPKENIVTREEAIEKYPELPINVETVCNLCGSVISSFSTEHHVKMFRSYADIQKQIEELEKEKEDLKNHIMGFMIEEDTSSMKLPFGNFIIGSRATWTYSPAVKDMENAVKKAKKDEEEKGIATARSSQYLMFKK